MRGTLHAPKPDDQRRRTNAPTHGATVLARDGELRGPELVELTGRADWPPHVVSWFTRWRTSPMAAVFEDTDWSRLGLLAWCIEALAIAPSAALVGEVRMNEERLGATFIDRQRARMTITDPEGSDAEPAPVLSIVPKTRDDLRRRLAQ
jgi:hypothetical protein